MGPTVEESTPVTVTGWTVRAIGAKPWLVAFGVALAVELFSFLIASTWTDEHADRFAWIAAQPFASGEVGLPEHRMRILGPTLSWLLGMSPIVGAYVIPWLANLPLLALAFRTFVERGGFRIACLFTALLATTHVTMSSRTLIGYQDSLGFLCIVFAMYTRVPWLAAVTLWLGFFADQRLIMLVPLVLFWHALGRSSAETGVPWRFVVSCGIAVAAWLATASALTAHFGLESKTAAIFREILSGEHSLSDIELGYLHLGYWMALRAGWVVVAIGLWVALRRTPRMFPVVFVTFAGVMAGALLIHDLSRGASFAFPLMFIGAAELAKSDRRSALTVLGTLLLTNVLMPAYQVTISGPWILSHPLPFEILRRM